MKLKVLKLHSLLGKSGLNQDFIDRCIYNHKKIDPILNRHGWYYDRIKNTSWMETQYGCFEDIDPSGFLYKLSLYEDPLPKKVQEAIEVLINYNKCPKKLMQIYIKNKEIISHKNFKTRSRMRIKREIKIIKLKQD